jgi:hypothetical protein
VRKGTERAPELIGATHIRILNDWDPREAGEALRGILIYKKFIVKVSEKGNGNGDWKK